MPSWNSRIPVARWLGSLAGAVASAAFPSGCRLCDELLTRADRLAFCDACLESFQKISGEVCARGGQPWMHPPANAEDDAICRECSARQIRVRCSEELRNL